MIYAQSGARVLENLQAVNSPGTGIQHWGSSYFGPRYSTQEVSSAPQALLTEMSAGETILPHFHGVTQFQIFPAGSGKMAKADVQPLMVQYKDHHTAYGPVIAGPLGLTFIALRNRLGDSAPVYLSKPGYKEKLKPSKRRNWMSPHIALSTRAVLRFRNEVAWETVFETEKIVDEMAAHLVRLGGAMSTMGPDPKDTGGYYVFVANGSLIVDAQDLPRWSMVYVDPTERPLEMKAGVDGLEALVLQFPRDDD